MSAANYNGDYELHSGLHRDARLSAHTRSCASRQYTGSLRFRSAYRPYEKLQFPRLNIAHFRLLHNLEVALSVALDAFAAGQRDNWIFVGRSCRSRRIAELLRARCCHGRPKKAADGFLWPGRLVIRRRKQVSCRFRNFSRDDSRVSFGHLASSDSNSPSTAQACPQDLELYLLKILHLCLTNFLSLLALPQEFWNDIAISKSRCLFKLLFPKTKSRSNPIDRSLQISHQHADRRPRRPLRQQ